MVNFVASRDITVKIVNDSFKNKRRKRGVYRMWKEYTVGKRTYKELSEQTKLSIPIIQSRLDKFKVKPESIKPREVMLVMDTTYNTKDVVG